MGKVRITLFAIIVTLPATALQAAIRVAPVPPSTVTNDFYVSNQKPLPPVR